MGSLAQYKRVEFVIDTGTKNGLSLKIIFSDNNTNLPARLSSYIATWNTIAHFLVFENSVDMNSNNRSRNDFNKTAKSVLDILLDTVVLFLFINCCTGTVLPYRHERP